jgi:uncharacterized protein
MNFASQIWTFTFLFLFGYQISSSDVLAANVDKEVEGQVGTASKFYDTRPTNEATDLDAILRFPPREYVQDLANILSVEQTKKIQDAISYLRKTSSNQIAILTIPSLQSRQLERFSLRVARAWGIGTRENDNGVLLLIAMKERKIRIEVGYGLERALTDAQAASIIRNEMTPNFKTGAYGFGTLEGINAIIEAINGEYNVEERSKNAKKPISPFWLFVICAPLFIVYAVIPSIAIILESRHRKKYKLEHGREPPGYYESSHYQNLYGGDGSDSVWGGGGFGGGGFGGGGASGGW